MMRYVPADGSVIVPVIASQAFIVDVSAVVVQVVCPFVAFIQFPPGRSAASIARNVTAVLDALEARKVRAPVD